MPFLGATGVQDSIYIDELLTPSDQKIDRMLLVLDVSEVRLVPPVS